jgi:hypothetical protein
MNFIFWTTIYLLSIIVITSIIQAYNTYFDLKYKEMRHPRGFYPSNIAVLLWPITLFFKIIFILILLQNYLIKKLVSLFVK